MRITGGKWRGAELTAIGKGDPKAHLRPSSDRTRETVFNILQNAAWRKERDLVDACVLDIFAGTGALGFEAESRGAREICFVDDGKTALSLLKKNIELLGSQAKILPINALTPPNASKQYDVVFMDPPYNQRLGEAALNAFIGKGWLSDGAIIYWEEETRPKPIAGLTLVDRRQSGRALLSFYRYQSPKT